MRERLTAIAGRGTTAWNSFTSGQKAVTIVAILALAVGGYFFATWAGKPLRGIDGVTAAPVHLAIPEKDVFADNRQKPTASVLVATGTKTLTPDKVQAIVHLIASSVDGLDPADVTVVGANGKVLSAG